MENDVDFWLFSSGSWIRWCCWRFTHDHPFSKPFTNTLLILPHRRPSDATPREYWQFSLSTWVVHAAGGHAKRFGHRDCFISEKDVRSWICWCSFHSRTFHKGDLSDKPNGSIHCAKLNFTLKFGFPFLAIEKQILRLSFNEKNYEINIEPGWRVLYLLYYFIIERFLYLNHSKIKNIFFIIVNIPVNSLNKKYCTLHRRTKPIFFDLDSFFIFAFWIALSQPVRHILMFFSEENFSSRIHEISVLIFLKRVFENNKCCEIFGCFHPFEQVGKSLQTESSP